MRTSCRLCILVQLSPRAFQYGEYQPVPNGKEGMFSDRRLLRGGVLAAGLLLWVAVQISPANADQVEAAPDGCLVHVYNPLSYSSTGRVYASAQLSCKAKQRLEVRVALWERNTKKRIWKRVAAARASRRYVVVDADVNAKCPVGRTTLYGVTAEAIVNGNEPVRIPLEFATKQKVMCRDE
jgi:hypothetical protein